MNYPARCSVTDATSLTAAAQDMGRFLQTFVLLNLYKEAGRHVMVSAAYYLTVADLNSGGLAVNRDAAIVPVVAYQTLTAIIFRLEVSNYDDPGVALATCLLQGVLEIALRLTAPERDAWVKRAFRRLGCSRRRRRGTALVVSSSAADSQKTRVLSKSFAVSASTYKLRSADTFERAAAVHERRQVIQLFNARMVLVDMWSEHAGICIGTMVLWLGHSNPLYYPFRPYRNYPDLLDGDSNYFGTLAFGAVVQIVIEVVTDTVCLVFERRKGLEPLTVWRKLPWIALSPLFLCALVYATLAGQIRSLYGDEVQTCNHSDLCACVNNGLQPGGMRELYCLMLYPNSSGLPPRA